MPQKKVSPAVAAFLAALPVGRRDEVVRVRDVVCRHLPAGYEEAISGKMLVYQVPLARYPDTYNGHPLWYVALASEKSYLSLHLLPAYANAAATERLQERFKAAGKKLNMGKACIRFARADDLELDVIGEIVASVTLDRWVETAKSARRR